MITEIYTVTFFGHRTVDRLEIIEKYLETEIVKLIQEKEYTEFLVGRDGEFDIIAASCITRVRKNYRSDNSSMTWVLPYSTADLRKNVDEYGAYYDSIEVCEEASRSHPKNAITKRNRSMIDRADLVICYVEHASGGAYQAMKYAEKTGKRIINIVETVDPQFRSFPD